MEQSHRQGIVAEAMLEEVAGYVGFCEADATLLAQLSPLLQPAFPAIIDAFYKAIESSPGASMVVTGGDAQVARLRQTLATWLEGLLSGVYDEAYFEQRARIGRAHVRIGLEQRYMFSAMNLIREQLHLGVSESAFSSGRIHHAHRAIDRICDVELAIMLETYREAHAQRIRLNERFASLGQLAASIAHDLRNPLAVMETSLHLLRGHVPDEPQVQKHLDRIGNQVRVSGRIIHHLLELAADRETNREPTDLGVLVREALAQVVHKPETRIELRGFDRPVAVTVDAGQLRRLLVNLLLNAVQAAEDEGARASGPSSGAPPVREPSSKASSSKDPSSKDPSSKDPSSKDPSAGDPGVGGRVCVRVEESEGGVVLSIEDDGPGIPTEAMEHLFEPLFTTRAQGMGLGLALAQQIASKHGAVIRALNRDGGGATFEVTLPR